MIDAGRLRDRVTFERKASVDDGYGNARGAWATLMTVWAKVRQPLGREVVTSGRAGEVATATVLLRNSSAARGLTAEDRMVFAGQPWDVQSVVPLLSDRGFIEVLVQRGVAT